MTDATPNGTRPIIFSDRQGFDRRCFAPELKSVWVPTHADQVADYVTAAVRTYGPAVKVVSGRHCYEDFVYGPGTHGIIDMSGLQQVGYDAAHGAYFVEAGAENWTVYRTLLNGFNKTMPAGSCYSVGAGGHITGGGYGLLSRLHGLTIDHLSGVDIVTWDARTAQAELRHVSPKSTDPHERDLFWALCGAGGGNFGVIVRYWFAGLPTAPEHATLWTLAWDWADLDLPAFQDLLAAYAELVETMPNTDFGLLKLQHVASRQIGLTLQLASEPGMGHNDHILRCEAQLSRVKARFDSVVRGAELQAPLSGHPGLMTTQPTSAIPQHVTYLEALQTLNGSGPNQFGKYKSAYMKKPFPEEQSAAIYRWLQTTPAGVQTSDMSQSLVQVDSYGGAINRIDSSATAVPQRSSLFKLQYQTYWLNESQPGLGHLPPYEKQASAHLDWIRGMYQDVYAAYGGTPDPAKDPSGTVDGAYFNYPDKDLGTHEDGEIDHALWLYFLDNYRTSPRNLQQVKRHWDPDNVFRHAQSIPVT